MEERWLDRQKSISLTARQWVTVITALYDSEYTEALQADMREQLLFGK